MSKAAISQSNKLAFERKAYDKGYKRVGGIDEAGRGPLAGPVVAACCILPVGLLIDGIDDSKKLTPLKRERLFNEITSNQEIQYGIGIVDAKLIDEINILQATIKAMHLAVSQIESEPDYLLVDGLKLNYPNIPSEKIIKGDSLSLSIGAASILAKVTRDRMMIDADQKWPQYGFSSHKGYGTKKHVEAIKEIGPCSIHRMTFEPIKSL